MKDQMDSGYVVVSGIGNKWVVGGESTTFLHSKPG